MPSYSPYAKTKINRDGALDILSIRPVPAYTDDSLYTIEPQYTHRPDLLAIEVDEVVVDVEVLVVVLVVAVVEVHV